MRTVGRIRIAPAVPPILVQAGDRGWTLGTYTRTRAMLEFG
jgi:hypothetical protein